jgi:hypothetical protein
MQLVNLEVVAGEDKTFSLNALTSSHAVKDLTGATLSFNVQSQFRDGAAYGEWVGSIVNAAAGTWSVTLTAADTQNMSGDYEFVGYATIASVTTVVTRGRLRVYDGALP